LPKLFSKVNIKYNKKMWKYWEMIKDRCFKKEKIDDELKDMILDLIDLQNEIIEYIEFKKSG
jgi:hypothetical protein